MVALTEADRERVYVDCGGYPWWEDVENG